MNLKDERDSQKPEVENASRRRFLGWVVGGVSGAIALAVATPLVGYFLSPAWKKRAPIQTPIARIDEIPVGVPTYVTYEQRVIDGWYTTTLSKGAWVVNKENGDLIVYDPRCTHLNCPYYWDKEKQIFQCPCHGGEFDINGNVLAGPPPRPLDRLEATISNGDILVSGEKSGGQT